MEGLGTWELSLKVRCLVSFTVQAANNRNVKNLRGILIVYRNGQSLEPTVLEDGSGVSERLLAEFFHQFQRDEAYTRLPGIPFHTPFDHLLKKVGKS